ncbi:hypothetical protein D8I35_05305 [Corticibacter populi]|uniref:Uncharacterized protein n=1 Tax=Corticibacter populi TaxID=1550736 RepID=A0A3M6QZW1_9BURK|nr:hypothetical protein D8I35_05305 [Corticibacter populi]
MRHIDVCRHGAGVFTHSGKARIQACRRVRRIQFVPQLSLKCRFFPLSAAAGQFLCQLQAHGPILGALEGRRKLFIGHPNQSGIPDHLTSRSIHSLGCRFTALLLAFGPRILCGLDGLRQRGLLLHLV